MKALLIGNMPPCDLGYEYAKEPPYEAVVIGSLPISQALRLGDERVLEALALGKPVTLYTPGLPDIPKNRALAASLASARREMKSWGIVFTDGAQKRLITAQEAKLLKQNGKRPAAGAVLTPLAREILEGTD